MLGACAINKVILMGRLTHDPELRQSQSGVMSCRFTVAIDRPQSAQAAQNGQDRLTDFITVVAFNRTAEFVSKYFNKGKLILVEGSIRTGSYVDKNHSDVTHYTADVWAENVSFGETKSSSQGGYGQPNNYSQNNNYNNNRGYNSAPQTPPAASQPGPSISVGDVGDFEDILSDGDLPF